MVRVKSQPAAFRPGRIVTLMELLRVYAHLYVEKATRLNISIDKIGQQSIWTDHQHRINLLTQLEELQEMCVTGELPVTKVRLDHIVHCLKAPERDSPRDAKLMMDSLNDEMLAHYLLDLRLRLVDELSTKMFFQLPNSRKELFETPLKKWESVTARWPETIGDIEEAGKCFALSRYAASVFHCIQVIEFGLLELGGFLKVKDPHSGWTAVSKQLKKIIDTEHNARTDFEKQHFPFIEQMQGTVEALKNAWRNKISHAHGKLTLLGSDFTPDIAEEIMTASRSFMRRLAGDLPSGV